MVNTNNSVDQISPILPVIPPSKHGASDIDVTGAFLLVIGKVEADVSVHDKERAPTFDEQREALMAEAVTGAIQGCSDIDDAKALVASLLAGVSKGSEEYKVLSGIKSILDSCKLSDSEQKKYDEALKKKNKSNKDKAEIKKVETEKANWLSIVCNKSAQKQNDSKVDISAEMDYQKQFLGDGAVASALSKTCIEG